MRPSAVMPSCCTLRHDVSTSCRFAFALLCFPFALHRFALLCIGSGSSATAVGVDTFDRRLCRPPWPTEVPSRSRAATALHCTALHCTARSGESACSARMCAYRLCVWHMLCVAHAHVYARMHVRAHKCARMLTRISVHAGSPYHAASSAFAARACRRSMAD